MARRTLDGPRPLLVCDLRAEALAPFVASGARVADLAQLAGECEVVSVVVLTDAQVRTVVETLVAHAAPGLIVAVHSTVEAHTVAELAELGAARGVDVLDAPVSGGAIGAGEGRLAVMVGGERPAYERVKPALALWAELVLHVGPAGAGTRCKLARNLLSFASFAVAAEAERLAEAAGIDLHKLAAVVRHSDALTGGAGSVMLRATTAPVADDDGLRPILEHTRSLGEKDLDQALALGRELGVELPFAELARSTLAAGLGVPHDDPDPEGPG